MFDGFTHMNGRVRSRSKEMSWCSISKATPKYPHVRIGARRMPSENQGERVVGSAAADATGDASAFEIIRDGFPLLDAADVKQKLLQWNMDHSLQIQRFRVQRKITKDKETDLINDFFHSRDAHERLQLPSTLTASKQPLKIERLRVTVTSLSFFDKLVDAKLVAESGALRRCLDEVVDGATASDLLKESMINPETENPDIFTEDEQQEFVYQIFRALVIGGSMSQSDEKLSPYEDMTKRFYKALVSVKKNAADANAIDITSHVFKVDDCSVFDSQSPFSSCFVVLDAKKRWLTVWHNTFRPFW